MGSPPAPDTSRLDETEPEGGQIAPDQERDRERRSYEPLDHEAKMSLAHIGPHDLTAAI
jgi:hypothetical protein